MVYITANRVTVKTTEGTRVGNTQATFPPPLAIQPEAVGYGPFTIRPRRSSGMTFSMQFKQPESVIPTDEFWPFDWDLPLLGMLVGAAASDRVTGQVSRRGLLAGIATVAGFSGSASADSPIEERTIATIDIADNPEGWRLEVADSYAGLFPVDLSFNIQFNGIAPDLLSESNGLTIPPGFEGTLEVTPDPDFLNQIRSAISNNAEAGWSLRLPSPASELSSQSPTTISSDPVIVAAVEEAGSNSTVVEIDGQAIPAEDELGDDLGEWAVDDEDLVYRSGPEAPDSDDVEIFARVGPLTEARADARQAVGR